MTINELLEALNEALGKEWVTLNSEVTIETRPPNNDSYHIDKEYPWMVYNMLDKTFSLTLGEKFSELEYDEVDDEPSMEEVERLEMKRKYDQDEITKDEYVAWLKKLIQGEWDDEDQS